MANKTDPLALSIHGTNPQYLIEKIVRGRIYANSYWINQCAGLTAETLVDKAIELTEFGGSYGGNNKPTKFLCLILKMLQLQPEKEIVVEFIQNQDHKYVRLLGAFYLRLVGKPVDIYQYLEPFYLDSRTIRKRTKTGTIITHVDEFIDELLTAEDSCDIHLPRLPKRWILEDKGELNGPRISGLDEDEINEYHEQEKAKLTDNNHDSDVGVCIVQHTKLRMTLIFLFFFFLFSNRYGTQNRFQKKKLSIERVKKIATATATTRGGVRNGRVVIDAGHGLGLGRGRGHARDHDHGRDREDQEDRGQDLLAIRASDRDQDHETGTDETVEGEMTPERGEETIQGRAQRRERTMVVTTRRTRAAQGRYHSTWKKQTSFVQNLA